MQENIIASMPGSTSPKPIHQSDIQKLLALGLVSLSEFNKLTEINRKTFSPFWVEIMPKIP